MYIESSNWVDIQSNLYHTLYMKTCRNCKILKPLDNFNNNPKNAGGKMTLCRECGKAYSKLYHSKNKEKDIKYRQLHKDRIKLSRETWYYKKGGNLKCRERILKNRFNITRNEYNRLLEQQNHKCAICKNSEICKDRRNNKLRELAVDHCHTTGKIRGLLCYNCNRGIGHLQDSLSILREALDYLSNNI